MEQMNNILTWNQVIQFSIYSLSALVLKAYFLYNTRFDPKNNISRSFLYFAFLLLINNALELVGYIFLNIQLSTSVSIVDYYFVTLYFGFPAMLNFALALGGLQSKKTNLVVFLVPSILTVLHFSGLMIDGVVFNSYTLIRIPSTLYPLFEIFAVSCAAATLAILLTTIKKSESAEKISRNKIALIGLFPFISGASLIIPLMRLDINISSAVFLPVMTVFLVFICLYSTKEEVLDLSMNFALTKKLFLEIIGALSTNPGTLTERIERIEKISIEIALYKSQGVQKEAARIMGVSESTLCRKISKFEAQEHRELLEKNSTHETLQDF